MSGPAREPLVEVAIGVGCDRGAALATFDRALADAGAQLGPIRVRRLATIDRKADEPAILALAAARGWPLVIYPGVLLARVASRNPSPLVMHHLGVPSVAEAAALLAAGAALDDLLFEKHKYRGQDGRSVTLSVARWRR